MVWLAPAALVGLAAALGPLIVHLLRRQRARTLVVPTVRFIPAVDQSVVRVRMPADVLLGDWRNQHKARRALAAEVFGLCFLQVLIEVGLELLQARFAGE